MKELFQKYRELISYGFFGVATTVVNYAVYFLVVRLAGLDILLGNVIAWVAAVAFAYVVNKLYVFESKSWDRDVVLREVWQFVSARLASFGFEEPMMLVFASWLGFNDLIVKIATSVFVIIINYVISKLVIFKK